jgi:Flp pilus assembly protein TadD
MGCEIWHALVRARWLAACTVLAMVGASTWFVSWPQRDPGLCALDPFNTGLKMLRVGNLELAQQKLETAQRLVPDNAEVNFGLGNLRYAKGDTELARYSYRRTIELDPKHAGAWTNLGRLEADERRWEVAERFLHSAINLDPTSARAHLFLAETKYELGDFAAARKAIARALELRPNQPELLDLQKKIERSTAP